MSERLTDLGLPGGEIVAEGLADLARGEETLASLIVSIAPTRLASIGLSLPGEPIQDPELRLYALLEQRYGNGAYSKYNAWLRQLASFIRARQCAR
ncbi:MAG: hypothetical protein RL885_22575 [Planctomycetota bacterium]